MKTNPQTRITATLAATFIGLAITATPARAADLYRNPSSGGNWSDSLWAASSGGPYNQSWTPGAYAIFEGSKGSVTVDGAFSLGGIDFKVPYTSGAVGSTLSGGTLNFTAGAKIRATDNRENQTITSTIAGSPAVETKDAGAQSYIGLLFSPASGNTQTLGAVLNPNNTGTLAIVDKAGVTFAGSTTGNTIASINYAGTDRFADTVFQSGEWTVAGNITTGTVRLSGGTAKLNGTVDALYNNFIFTGGKLGGKGTINENLTVPAAGNLSPGDPTGTLSIIGTLDISAIAAGTGKLEYELGPLAGTNDRIAVTGTVTIGSGVLGSSDFTFTNLGGVQAGTYVLLSATGGFTGTLDPAARSVTIGGLTGLLQIKGNNLVWATDTDLDGMPDDFELAYTSPASTTSLDPAQDIEFSGTGDGLTNLEEYLYGTNPNNNDTDADTLEDGPEVKGLAGARPPTSPTRQDTDGDLLSDLAETNTGTWVNATNTGTNPTDRDSDKDGLTDTVETGTGTFVSTTNTGTNPNLPDTDGDTAWDWYEVVASYTNPHNLSARPNIPYPLPDPDGSTGSASKVKVYIMSGQSNMVGIGYVTGTKPGSLETIAKRENKFPNLVTSSNDWTSRNDVYYRGVITATGNAPLTPGVGGADSSKLGPELGFGHVMGWFHDEPVLLLKTSQGNRSLGWEFLPPGSAQYTISGTTYAGYGDSPASWPAGTTPTPNTGCAGLQYDQCFLNEADMSPIAFANGAAGTNVVDILDNWTAEYAAVGKPFAGRDFEIAGFVWWQGHKDGGDVGNDTASVYATRYEQNLVNLIQKLREYYNNRYPGKISLNAPCVVATVGFTGGAWNEGSSAKTIWKAQMAVGDPAKHPEFAGTVASVDTTGYWRDVSVSPGEQGYHYNNNAETYTLVGDALGRAMISIQDDATPPSPDPMSFAVPPTAVDATTVGMVAATATDVYSPVEYYFENTTNSNNSGWITNTRWNNTGLAGGTYAYRVKARDAKGNETAWSATSNGSPGNDVTAPTPSPMTFATPPAALAETSVKMTSTAASDINGVEYFFECTAGGGHSSAWQDSPTYTDTSLTAGTPYSYRVRARDKSAAQTATAWSATASATTTALDTTAPTPDPMTFASPPAAPGQFSVIMIATTATDPSGVEYFFECTAGGGHSSAWQDTPTYTDTSLTAGTQYSYRVRARDKSAAQNPTDWSATASATTSATSNILYKSVGATPFAWNNTSAAWGVVSGGPYNTATWSGGDYAIFEGTQGTVTIAEPITIGNLTFTTTTGGYTVNGNTLNFTPGSTIRTSDNRYNQTITSAITGSPAVETKDAGAANTNLGFLFAPSAGTQTLGAVLNPNNTGNSDKAGVTFAGSTTGNSVASINYAGGDRFADTVFQSGEWTVAGNINTGTLKVTGGSHTLSGTVGCYYTEMRVTGGTVKGVFTIFSNSKASAPYVSGTGTIAPGNNGIGTVTLDWGITGGAAAGIGDYAFSLQNGSTYEWEVGEANTTDKIHLTEGRLYLQNFTLKITDAGGNPVATDQLPVFTYATGVTRDLTAFPNLAANFILPAGWTGTPSLVDGGNGTIYLTGINGASSQTPYETWAVGGVAFDADANNDGVDNGMAWLLGAANPSENALGKLPSANRNGASLRLTFRCLKSAGRGGVALKVQSSNDLGVSDPWTNHEAAVPDADGTVNGVIFDTTADANPAFINVIADIPAAGSKIFGRLSAVITP